MNAPPRLPVNELGALLRHWRDRRGKSQLDLSLDTGISQKQISFVESGRSVPTRHTLMSLFEALDIPLRDRNSVLLAAGYAPLYADGAWDAAEMRSIAAALRRILAQHEPFPALVMDRYWNMVMTNAASPRFFNRFIDLAARESPRNLLHLMFDPKGMRPFIANWEAAARGLFERVYRESVGRVVDDKTKALLTALLAYPDIEIGWKNPVGGNALPMIPLNFVHEGTVMSFFSMVTTVGTPQTIAAQELRLESLFPADEASEAHYRALIGEGTAEDA